MAKAKSSVHKLSEMESIIKCKNVEGATYIFAEPGLEVYDNRGKRRIGKNCRLKIYLNERVVYNDEEYRVKEITDTKVMLKKI